MDATGTFGIKSSLIFEQTHNTGLEQSNVSVQGLLVVGGAVVGEEVVGATDVRVGVVGGTVVGGAVVRALVVGWAVVVVVVVFLVIGLTTKSSGYGDQPSGLTNESGGLGI